MDQPITKPTYLKRIVFGTLGTVLLLVGLCILYWTVGSWIDWWIRWGRNADLFTMLFASIMGAIPTILLLVVCAMFLIYAYLLFSSSIKGVPLEEGSAIFLFIIFLAIIFITIGAYGYYKIRDPHIGELISIGDYVKGDNVFFLLQQPEATNQLDLSRYSHLVQIYPGCDDPNISATPGWKFIVYIYQIDNNRNESIDLPVSSIEDESGIRYNEFTSACFGPLGGGIIPANNPARGAIIFKIPISSTPAKFKTSIDWPPITITLHNRWHGLL